MKSNDYLYYKLNNYFQDTFGEKIYKISLDGGFTCPNRDGKVGIGGCIFCNETGSGEFTEGKLTITNQINNQLKLIVKKFPHGQVIAYFQNFTNTYGDIEQLRKVYNEALLHPRVIGIAIATRPDCLGPEIIELLQELNEKTFLWIELGLQTINEKVARIINRCYDNETFIQSAKILSHSKIKFVTHLIIGLPGEEANDPIKTALFAVKNLTWGIKIHSMYIDRNTKLHELLLTGKYKPITIDYYINKLIEIIQAIPSNIVVHRITGDPYKKTLVEPLWTANKKAVLNEIHNKMKKEKIYQGKVSEMYMNKNIL
ncbi:TIGR01212 family radical SAM protein [Fusobacterium sp. PH5-44]|uniref:TIGR01212 family radical SAM protein n=1 Tax=unclassified Fusobacterium TaxID=2648384 RepID=UPI003D1E5295